MSEFEKEYLKDIQSNCFWAGFLNDLPKDEAWKVADEIVEAVNFALKQANGVDKSTDPALRINSVSNRRELLIAFGEKLANILGEDCKGMPQVVDMYLKGNL